MLVYNNNVIVQSDRYTSFISNFAIILTIVCYINIRLCQLQPMTAHRTVIGCKLKQNANGDCNSCASLAGLVLSFLLLFANSSSRYYARCAHVTMDLCSCNNGFILLVIATYSSQTTLFMVRRWA